MNQQSSGAALFIEHADQPAGRDHEPGRRSRVSRAGRLAYTSHLLRKPELVLASHFRIEELPFVISAMMHPAIELADRLSSGRIVWLRYIPVGEEFRLLQARGNQNCPKAVASLAGAKGLLLLEFG